MSARETAGRSARRLLGPVRVALLTRKKQQRRVTFARDVKALYVDGRLSRELVDRAQSVLRAARQRGGRQDPHFGGRGGGNIGGRSTENAGGPQDERFRERARGPRRFRKRFHRSAQLF